MVEEGSRKGKGEGEMGDEEVPKPRGGGCPSVDGGITCAEEAEVARHWDTLEDR